jgi:hypothetical protein
VEFSVSEEESQLIRKRRVKKKEKKPVEQVSTTKTTEGALKDKYSTVPFALLIMQVTQAKPIDYLTLVGLSPSHHGLYLRKPTPDPPERPPRPDSEGT